MLEAIHDKFPLDFKGFVERRDQKLYREMVLDIEWEGIQDFYCFVSRGSKNVQHVSKWLKVFNSLPQQPKKTPRPKIENTYPSKWRCLTEQCLGCGKELLFVFQNN